MSSTFISISSRENQLHALSYSTNIVAQDLSAEEPFAIIEALGVCMQDKYRQLRVGLVGLGLEAYWSQFAGLEQRLLGYLDDVEQRISNDNRLIVNLGLVDTPEKSLDAAHDVRCKDIDILLVYVTTYSLSAIVLPLIKRAQVPVILLNLQPASAMDYERLNAMESRTAMTGEWLAHCPEQDPCPSAECVSRQGRRWTLSGDVGEAWSHHLAVDRRGWPARLHAADRRGRERSGADFGNRQYE